MPSLRLHYLALLSLVFTACSSAPSPLNPASARATELSQLWWGLFIVAAPIIVLVAVLLVWGVIRTPSEEEQRRDHEFGTHLVWIAGIAAPIVILASIFVVSVLLLRGADAATDLTVEVVGHQWWWEIRYPQQAVTTANEIHIPAGAHAKVLVTTADVIHGFWVPQLQGKIDAIPNQTNTLDLAADQPGTYRGSCLVFCADQHANMNLIVVAEPRAQFQNWLSGQAATPPPPTSAQLLAGQEVFETNLCASCHTIKGTTGLGTAGPDLTHLGSRKELAAGTIPNTPDNLAEWISDPQSVKPGNLMPRENLTGSQLDSLVAYLESLK